MSLLSGLRKASYNGISFHVVSGTWKGGRRTVTHEYPQRDYPFVEDLGKATDTFTLECFVNGSDYINQSKRLMSEFKKAGTGSLVHPWLGAMDVQVIDVSEISWDLNLGQASFNVTFLEPGKIENPSAGSSWGDKLRGFADDLYGKAVAVFEAKFPVDGLSISSVVTDVINNYQSLSTALTESKFARMFDCVDELKSMGENIGNILNSDLSSMASSLSSVFDISAEAESNRDWAQSTGALAVTAGDSELSAHHEKAQSVNIITDTPSVYYSALMSNSIEKLSRQSMLASMLGAVSMIGTDIDTQKDQLDSDTLIELRANILNTLESEMRMTEKDEDDTYLTLSDAYAFVYQDLTSRLISMGGMVDYTPTEVKPVLTISYDKYVDSNRDLEIIRRNKIRHPLFCPIQTLRLEKE